MNSAVKVISPDDLVMAKELVDYFRQQGVTIHYAYARAIIVACPASVRRRYVHARDGWTFWVLHPEFQPFSERPPRAGVTRDLSEMAGNS